MILDAIIGTVVGLLSAAFSLLPTGSLQPILGSVSGDEFGQWLGYHEPLFPFIFVLDLWAALLAILIPAVVIYKVANWAYRHFPQMGGFGPGAG